MTDFPTRVHLTGESQHAKRMLQLKPKASYHHVREMYLTRQVIMEYPGTDELLAYYSLQLATFLSTGPPRSFVGPGAKYRFGTFDNVICVIRSCLWVDFLL